MVDRKEYFEQWHKDNPDYMKQWRKDNPEKRKNHNQTFYMRNRQNRIEESLEYQRNNPEKRKLIQKRYRDNKRTDLKFGLNHKMGTAIGISLKGNKAGRCWETLVDYTINDLIIHLKKSMPKGYTWKDYLNGKLVIDHIIPVRAFIFKFIEDKGFRMCWSLYNLRLLTKKENQIKKDNIDNPILLGLAMEGDDKKCAI